MQGLTLVELMVAMTLGLVVIGGAISLTLANRQSYRTNEGLSQVQESGRTAFELLARDLRQAGLTGCDSGGRVANVLNQGGGEWWTAWVGILGIDGEDDNSAVAFGTGRSARVAGTDAVQLQGIEGLGVSVDEHNTTSAALKLTDETLGIAPGDILIVCDFDHATIFQATNYNSSNVTLVHNTGTEIPGNCAKGLGYPEDCSTTNGNEYQFERNSQLGRFSAVDWYIGQSGRTDDSSRSLFRRRLGPGGALVTEEVVAGVTDMQLSYRIDDSDEFVDADAAITGGQWSDVNAVRVVLTVESGDARISTDNTVNAGRLERQFAQVVTLRNRVP
ncbi:MAG TPA: PilW family protein [Steroidobacteraceae bacterium]|nr:PilW family protein [Steroidobacteraceae bacterium]